MNKLIAIALFIGVLACQDKKLTSNNEYLATENKIEEQEIKSAEIEQKTADQTLLGYLKIKDTLVETDVKAASFAAEGILFDLERNENKVIDKLFKEVRLIAESKDIEDQRIYFVGLSNNIYTLVKNTETEMTVYQQYCPMAFDDKGADWLSKEKEIKNPYFGSSMLTCGEMKSKKNK
jgi:hypothetical protein